jgi:histidine triad (HIT) family protein
MPTLFSRIIAGEIPSYKIYEDEKIYAFLDIHPIKLGHVLVVPKTEIGDILDMSDDALSELMLTAKNIIAPAIKKATSCERVGFSVEGLGVKDHMHLHLIPLYVLGDFDPAKAHTETPENMTMIAGKILDSLSQ